MTPYEFRQSFDKLCALRGTKPSEDLFNVWYEACSNLPEKAFRRATQEWVEANTRFPSIREVKGIAYSFMTPTDKGETTEVETSPEEEALFRIMFPSLSLYLQGRMTKTDFVALLRWEARKLNLEHRIPWDQFETKTVKEPA